MIKKIAITGPESTGKSNLSEQLAFHYNTSWVPEYAREYLGNLNRPYKKNDIVIIAKNQVKSENVIIKKANNFLFCDTDLIVTKIWSEVKYNNCDQWILDKINNNTYDLFLLCNIDLPWENDPLREHPDEREDLMKLFENELSERKLPFLIISGSGKDRLNNAIKAIDKTFKF